MDLPIQITLPEGFLNEEVRCGYTVSEKMKAVWAVELDLLVEFQHICELLNIKYFLDSGSLLGVIRDERFIPWDDDIDVIMLRKDYDVLISNYSLFRNPYFLQHATTEFGYSRPHAQLRNTKTCAMIPSEKGRVQFNQGIFIDIFVLDGISEDWSKEFNTIIRMRNHIKKINYPPTSNRVARLLKEIRKHGIIARWGSQQKIYQDLENYVRGFDKTEYVDKVLFREKESQVKRLKRDWFDKSEQKKLEFVPCTIPAEYDEILKVYYGLDYIIPRLEATMHGQGGNMMFDPYKSYKEYMK